MLKKYNKLWVIGDSYTTPNVCVSPQDSFWGLTATHLNIPTIKNCSQSGNSFESICHILINTSVEFNWDSDLFLIGLPPLERITVYDHKEHNHWRGFNINIADWKIQSFEILSHHGLICESNFGKDRNAVLNNSRSWTETRAMREIFLLTSWLDSKNANYLIVNLSQPLNSADTWGANSFLLPYCNRHPRCILFNNTYYSVNYDVNKPTDFNRYGWAGHQGAAGNKHFFEKSILPTLEKNNLI